MKINGDLVPKSVLFLFIQVPSNTEFWSRGSVKI